MNAGISEATLKPTRVVASTTASVVAGVSRFSMYSGAGSGNGVSELCRWVSRSFTHWLESQSQRAQRVQLFGARAQGKSGTQYGVAT